MKDWTRKDEWELVDARAWVDLDRTQLAKDGDRVAFVEDMSGNGAHLYPRHGLTLSLPTATRLALRKAASEMNMTPEEAAAKLLYDALMAAGHIELHEIDEGSETEGEG